MRVKGGKKKIRSIHPGVDNDRQQELPLNSYARMGKLESTISSSRGRKHEMNIFKHLSTVSVSTRIYWNLMSWIVDKYSLISVIFKYFIKVLWTLYAFFIAFEIDRLVRKNFTLHNHFEIRIIIFFFSLNLS